jgi:hypothetical protein
MITRNGTWHSLHHLLKEEFSGDKSILPASQMMLNTKQLRRNVIQSCQVKENLVYICMLRQHFFISEGNNSTNGE